MQFMRMNLNNEDRKTSGEGRFYTFLNAANFSTLDGQEIPSSIGTNKFYFKYKYDYSKITAEAPNQGGLFSTDNNNLCFYDSVDSIKAAIVDLDDSDGYCLFFIPLKNQGFYITGLQYYRSNESDYYNTEPMNATPKLRNRDKGVFFHRQDPDSTQFNTISVTGFFNEIDNKYNYFCSETKTNFSQDFLDFTKGKIQRGTAIFRDLENIKTDYKANVCTLIKYPYESGFLNNLFIITTVPQLGCTWDFTNNIWTPNNNAAYGLSNKFFSFGGRNFYGIDSNLAVELPADNQR